MYYLLLLYIYQPLYYPSLSLQHIHSVPCSLAYPLSSMQLGISTQFHATWHIHSVPCNLAYPLSSMQLGCMLGKPENSDVCNVHNRFFFFFCLRNCIPGACILVTNLKRNESSKYATQLQQQRPELPTVTLTWHACKYKVHKLHPTPLVNLCTLYLHACQVDQSYRRWLGYLFYLCYVLWALINSLVCFLLCFLYNSDVLHKSQSSYGANQCNKNYVSYFVYCWSFYERWRIVWRISSFEIRLNNRVKSSFGAAPCVPGLLCPTFIV